MTYDFDQRPNTVLSEGAKVAIRRIKSSEYAVLVGRNNTGKTYLLSELAHDLGQSASYIGPARYQNFNVLPYFTPSRNDKRPERYRQFLALWQNQQQNIDNSRVNLQQAIAELTDTKRAILVEIVKLLLGSGMEILYTLPENTMSQKYISADGHNMSFASSGYRLITTILTSLLDDTYDTFLIDEPTSVRLTAEQFQLVAR